MRIICLSILISVLIICCKKETIISNGDFISFSVDTLMFDTVFTTVGSATRYVKIYNNYNTDININNIKLEQEHNSSFKINIDGKANYNITNTLLRARDSMYIFAEVTIDPNNLNQPIIETDAIVFSYEDQIQKINLVAWGRDAYFHSGMPDYQQYSPQSENLASMEYCDFYATFGIDCPEEYIGESFNYYSVDEHTTWTNDKPHVIYGNLIVENGAILTIQAGSEIYLHNNSSLLVSSASSIHANGTINNLIWFQSDRFDSHSLTDYANTPGQWGKIWILPGSINNIFNYTILKNGQTGIQIDGNLHTSGNKSILANDFTQINSDGRGVHTIGGGRGEMVSIFTYYCDKSFFAESGGFIRGLNCSSAYGEKGAVAINGDEVVECGIKEGLKIVDLTGAGDLFAAGFLHGHVNNMSLKESLDKGTEMSSKVIQQIGARL